MFSFVMLHKLAEFNHQTILTSQVIQQNVFCVSCLDDVFDNVVKLEYLKS